MPILQRLAVVASRRASGCPPWNLRTGLKSALAILMVTLALISPAISHAQSGPSVPSVTITSVKVNSDSVKIDFLPVPGAKDYRVYDVTDPYQVKYAGTWHLDADTATWPWSNMMFNVDSSGNPIYPLSVIPNPAGGWSAYHHIDVPATEIEYNGLVPGQPTTLVVEAVDAQGPMSYMSLYADNSNGINQRTFPLDSDCNPSLGICALGSNMGCTWWADQQNEDVMTTNGQGDYHNDPNVIARSQPFVVTANGAAPLPDTNSASQVFCDTFNGNCTVAPYNVISAGNNYGTGIEATTLTTPAGVWDVRTKAIDTVASSPVFVDGNHMMGVVFDSDHVGYGAVSYSPEQTISIANGQIAHVTFEVDAHTDGRRWVALAITPSNDPLTGYELPTNEGNANVNSTGNWVFWQWEGSGCLVNEGYGLNGPYGFTDWGILGAAGQATYYNNQRIFQNYQFGHGLDNRSRFDVFFSQSHFSMYEDGQLESSYDFPVPLSFSQVKVYYNAYMYHSALEQLELEQNAGYETYWINTTPTSDERHWDNMGFEVLPASTSWSSLGSLIQMPQAQAPTYVSGTSGGILPTAPTLPSAPQSLSSSAGNAQVSLTWKGCSGASSYDVYRGTRSGSESLYKSGVTSTNWVDSGATNGTTYYYVATAANSAGQSGKSNETSATPLGGPVPKAPTYLVAKASAVLVNLTWNGPPSATSYNVYRGTKPGGESPTPIATGVKNRMYTDRTANRKTTFYYTVSASNANGTSGMSNEAASSPYH